MRVLLTLIIVFAMTTANVQQGEQFPDLSAETLAGDSIRFPDDVQGTYTLLVLAFKRGAQPLVDSWLDPFIQRYSNNKLVDYYEIPMISGGWKVLSGWIDSGMRSGVPGAKHGHVATYYGPLKSYIRQLKIEDLRDSYVFLLNPNGQIIWSANGKADKNSLNRLFQLTDEKTNQQQ